MRTLLRFGFVVFLALPLWTATAAEESAPPSRLPVVVELFTSQGCSSCPPADAYFESLAERDDVIALGFHVDYWDYIGWKDIYASPDYTQRQRDYAASLGGRYVYTPQVVIQGAADAVGSEKRSIEWKIRHARKMPQVEVGLAYDEQAQTVTLSVPDSPIRETHAVLLAVYDDEAETEITRGENAGHTITYAHPVRKLKRLGTWDGKALSLPIALADLRVDKGAPYACAVLLQSLETGHILGAASLELAAGQ
jgi:hypothetical protein